MAKVSQHFTITKHLVNKAFIVFDGIVYNNDPENYDIEDVSFHIKDNQGVELVEDITQWFHSFRQLTDPEFHHDDICELLAEWLNSDEAKFPFNHLKEAA